MVSEHFGSNAVQDAGPKMKEVFPQARYSGSEHAGVAGITGPSGEARQNVACWVKCEH